MILIQSNTFDEQRASDCSSSAATTESAVSLLLISTSDQRRAAMASFLLKYNTIITPTFTQVVTPLVEQVRTAMKVRYYLKFHSETKRYRKKGFNANICTPGKKALVMRKILKGEKILALPGYP